MNVRHPVHDRSLRLWPECDQRPVTASVMATYLGCDRATLHRRTRIEALGAVTTVAHAIIGAARRGSGVFLVRPDKQARGYHLYVPAVIYRAKGLGRWCEPGFDPEDPRELFECPLEDTAARLERVGGGMSNAVHERLALAISAFASLGQTLVAAAQPPLQRANVINFSEA